MFDFLLPYKEDLEKNPVFVFKQTQLKGPRRRRELARYGRIVFLVILTVSVGSWAAITLLYGSLSNNALPALMVVIGLAVAVLSSLYSLITPLDIIQRDITSGYWADVSLTPQPASARMDAYRAITRITVWQISIVEVCIRLCTVIVVVLTALYGLWVDRSGQSGSLLLFFSPAVVTIPLAVIYVVEPLVRMGILVDLGLFFILRLRRFRSALITGVVVLATLAFLEAVTLLAPIGVINMFFLGDPDSSTLALNCFVCGCPMILFVLYCLYLASGEGALQRAVEGYVER